MSKAREKGGKKKPQKKPREKGKGNYGAFLTESGDLLQMEGRKGASRGDSELKLVQLVVKKTFQSSLEKSAVRVGERNGARISRAKSKEGTSREGKERTSKGLGKGIEVVTGGRRPLFKRSPVRGNS